MKIAFAILFAAFSCTLIQADDWVPEEGFTALFNGKNLTGWGFREKTPKGVVEPGKVSETFTGRSLRVMPADTARKKVF